MTWGVCEITAVDYMKVKTEKKKSEKCPVKQNSNVYKRVSQECLTGKMKASMTGEEQWYTGNFAKMFGSNMLTNIISTNLSLSSKIRINENNKLLWCMGI